MGMEENLDQLIAERVMGWQPIPETDEGYRWLTDTMHRRLTVLPFSRSMDFVWQVVERMDSQGYRMELGNFGGWQCSFKHIDAVDYGTHGMGQSAAEAICRAALATVREGG